MKSLFLFLATVLFTITIPAADAQLLPRWFGPKTPEKNSAVKPAQPDPRRVVEVNVEVAWLADPVTFPYYLEAHVNGSQLEVRGYVPDRAVREQAVRIAQVYSTMPVVDSMKEHPSLLVRPSQMSPQQLQSSVMSSLRVALPKQYQQLKAECSSDGKVYVVGAVTSFEEKMLVSHSLRRLHGCTSVQNLTSLPGEVVSNSPRDKTPIVKTSNSSEKPVVAVDKTKPWWSLGKAPKTTTDEPALLEKPKGPVIVNVKTPVEPMGPILIPTLPEPKKEVVKVEPTAPLSALELQKRIQASVPKLKSVEVEFTPTKEVRITLEILSEKDLDATADRVFALPELQNLRPELQFKISAP